MFDFKCILKLIDNLIQFFEKKTVIFNTEWILPNLSLEFFEIHFQTLCILQAKLILDILLVAVNLNR